MVFKYFAIYFASFSVAEVIENPAIASKCKRMALRRVNGGWESTHIPSECAGVDGDEEAARLCKEVFREIFFNLAQKTIG